jgi:hypothetical protein
MKKCQEIPTTLLEQWRVDLCLSASISAEY